MGWKRRSLFDPMLSIFQMNVCGGINLKLLLWNHFIIQFHFVWFDFEVCFHKIHTILTSCLRQHTIWFHPLPLTKNWSIVQNILLQAYHFWTS